MERRTTALARFVAGMGLALALLVPGKADAQDSGFGLGVVLGDPSGLSLKGYVGPTVSLDGGVGWGLIADGYFSAYLDFLWEKELATWDRANPALYFGVGPKIGLFPELDLFRVGARAPVGVTFQFTQVPLDVFVEVAAGLWIIEDADFDIDLGVGARYWF